MNPLVTLERLQAGETVQVRPSGSSMTPRIRHRQQVTLIPVEKHTPVKEGDVVFCKVRGRFHVHVVSRVDGDRYEISNARGHVNGWTGREKIYGKVVKVSGRDTV